MHRVLITGGAGFIGCELGAVLSRAGHEVLAFDNLHPQVHTEAGTPARLAQAVRLQVGDVTHADNFRSLFQIFRPDVVVHLAAETGTGQSLTEASRHAEVNVVGTTRLLDALTSSGHVPGHFLIASSRAVYGDGAWRDGETIFYPPGRSREALKAGQWDFHAPSGRKAEPLAHAAATVMPRPISVYGATKLAQEHLLEAWTRAFGAKLSVLRLQNVYGLGQAPKNPYTGILTLFAQLTARKQQLEVYEDGNIIRDFVHVSDVVAAMAACIGGGITGTFDIGSGRAVTVAEVAQRLSEFAGAPAPRVTGAFRDGDVRAAFADISAARAAFGYQPKVSVDEGLRSLLAVPRS